MSGVTPIRRLLIANRGEIACRIARTARRMGIETVGVYSEADAGALHVDSVDMAVALGGTTPAESYLRSEVVIQAALDTGCDALHPGYGFLAENAGFARQVAAAGLIWVGPAPDQIELLGNKVAAKQAAVLAGVPTAPAIEATPGEPPGDIPLPAVVKAAAGGGGRGMRIVRDAAALAEAVEAASREALSAFGDGRIFIEPYLDRARHIEVQIIGDVHGTIIHLGERDCSIQRRNQKIIEEAPAVGISPELRNALCDGAVALAAAVGYRSAGTVEFLVGDDGSINFLEVNTRLQVEHPVTEAVTGLDLVELQLRVAAGEPLPITQADVVIDGHAIEARLVAEDPGHDWMPATGQLTGFTIETDDRVDSGVRPGSLVPADYDSLLAKVIAHAPTRGEAAQRLARTLRAAHLAGPATNRNTLVATLADPDFVAGVTSTHFFDEHPGVLTATGPAGDGRTALLLAAVVHRKAMNHPPAGLWGFVRAGWRNLPIQGIRSTWLDQHGNQTCIEEVWKSDSRASILIGPWPAPDADGALGADERRIAEVRVLAAAPDRVGLEIDGVRRSARVAGRPEQGITTSGSMGGVTWTLQRRFVDHTAEEAGSGPVAPLPGTVIAVHVEAGDVVGDGDVLMIVEAMKMEHKILASGSATVGDVRFAVGDRVDAGDLLVRLDHGD